VVKAASENGIDIRMVTGDHLAIAKQVAGQLNLGQNISVATDVFGEGEETDDPEVVKQISEADGFVSGPSDWGLLTVFYRSLPSWWSV
jgi:H+-transporting ATPase